MQIAEGLLGADERAMLRLRQLYADSGYRRFRMSKFEHYDLYAQNRDVLVSDRVLTFTDAGGGLKALRPDVTLSIVKAYRDGQTERLQYNETIYRPDAADGEFREIMQSGVELLGSVGTREVCEVLVLAARSLQALGAGYMLTISHMGLLRGALARATADTGLRQELVALTGSKNAGGLAALCAARGIPQDAQERLMLLVQLSGAPGIVLPELRGAGFAGEDIEALDEACEALIAAGFEQHVRLDFSIGTDAAYYGGIVFRGYLAGLPHSVLSGGRYDPLLRRFGKSSGAVGFAVYLDQLERLANGGTTC